MTNNNDNIPTLHFPKEITDLLTLISEQQTAQIRLCRTLLAGFKATNERDVYYMDHLMDPLMDFMDQGDETEDLYRDYLAHIASFDAQEGQKRLEVLEEHLGYWTKTVLHSKFAEMCIFAWLKNLRNVIMKRIMSTRHFCFLPKRIERVKIALVFLLVLLSFVGCDKLFKDDELTMTKQPYQGNELKLDGFYYEINAYTNKIGESVFLFRDGTMLFCGGSIENDEPFDFMESLLSAPNFIKQTKEHISHWGVFHVEGNDIQYQRWYPGDGGLPAYHHEGTIINDTMFVIEKITKLNSDNEISDHREFFYQHYTPKPDSTNQFIH